LTVDVQQTSLIATVQLKSVIVQDWQAPGAALAFDSSNYGEMATPWGKGKGERGKVKGER
jgi:hypothetical protein